MADYKELLRKAITALPENNGAARRAVYERARSALVGQLRNLDPPLPARDITQHRLQLEDCIRQVEQEASEAALGYGRDDRSARPSRAPRSEPERAPPMPPPPPQQQAEPDYEEVAEAEPEYSLPDQRDTTPEEPAAVDEMIVADPETTPEQDATAYYEEDEEPLEDDQHDYADDEPYEDDLDYEDDSDSDPLESIESIIAAAESASDSDGRRKRRGELAPDEAESENEQGTSSEPPPVVEAQTIEPQPQKQGFRLFPSLAARGSKARGATPVVAPNGADTHGSATPRAGIANGSEAIVATEGAQVQPALSSVREVEPEASYDPLDAEGAIERAIQTLDREARGEPAPQAQQPAGKAAVAEDVRPDAEYAPAPAGAGEALSSLRAHDETRGANDIGTPDTQVTEDEGRGGGGGLTIFLIVFALLLAGAGGAGYWAWREGYVDLDQMFGRVSTDDPATPQETVDTTQIPTLDAPPAQQPAEEPTQSPVVDQTGPGNTTSEPVSPEPTAALEGLEPDEDADRLQPSTDTLDPIPEPVDPSDGANVLNDDRLPSADDADTSAPNPAASVDPVDLAGSQSLLLEASSDGRTGAVPFSGTVEWTQGTDELGLPTIEAEASIPARNLDVSVVLRRNSDPSLPASHLMEVTFDVPDSFIGGSISSLPGVLLKNEELVQGTPLEGASARVVGNSFLFALSQSEEDLQTNRDLLGSRKWMDLAVIYATGQRAIITLEKDTDAEALFDEVLEEWQAAGNGDG
ncbi:hypothetical protein GCM10007989_25010 [Devosia pacifica]|uniref:CheA signal transduction histidine kinase n=1 Tax=Devosia pacifica TaxID=1335967 RepID=A0A918VTQ1_9HYPH|nr:hypothetical protein [Devosia pacifica]GHA28040.1 hypothetical protein GCM10007989_25010 [Devosia pacifica]